MTTKTKATKATLATENMNLKAEIAAARTRIAAMERHADEVKARKDAAREDAMKFLDKFVDGFITVVKTGDLKGTGVLAQAAYDADFLAYDGQKMLMKKVIEFVRAWETRTQPAPVAVPSPAVVGEMLWKIASTPSPERFTLAAKLHDFLDLGVNASKIDATEANRVKDSLDAMLRPPKPVVPAPVAAATDKTAIKNAISALINAL